MCDEGIIMERMVSIQRGYHTFRQQNTNHCPPFLPGKDKQWSCHVERSAALQGLRVHHIRLPHCVLNLTSNCGLKVTRLSLQCHSLSHMHAQ
ncbi:hypothetical protein TNCV_4611801 [Trichonephila clavipes]|nr:hypothetical protein TNCV_4611801 [Trichonephila clavipes]